MKVGLAVSYNRNEHKRVFNVNYQLCRDLKTEKLNLI